MNKENVLKVADAIEAHKFPRLGFNMRWFYLKRTHTREADMSGHDCGTVACIAGWSLVTERDAMPRNAVRAEAAAPVSATAYLGLSEEQAFNLFFPDARHDHDITATEAVRVLRHLAETGEVDWSKANV